MTTFARTMFAVATNVLPQHGFISGAHTRVLFQSKLAVLIAVVPIVSLANSNPVSAQTYDWTNLSDKQLTIFPEHTGKASVAISGDLAVVHPNGYIQVKDRSKDIIISGGENISSVEVENIIAKHESVSLVAVVAKPDEKWGETPCAFIELINEDKTITDGDIINFCKQNMAGFKIPKHVIFRELPKTSTGKIQKFELRKKAKEI